MFLVLLIARKYFSVVYLERLGGTLGACLILSHVYKLFSEILTLLLAMHLNNCFSVPFSILDIGRLKSLSICYISKGIFLFQFVCPQFASVIYHFSMLISCSGFFFCETHELCLPFVSIRLFVELFSY